MHSDGISCDRDRDLLWRGPRLHVLSVLQLTRRVPMPLARKRQLCDGQMIYMAPPQVSASHVLANTLLRCTYHMAGNPWRQVNDKPTHIYSATVFPPFITALSLFLLLLPRPFQAKL